MTWRRRSCRKRRLELECETDMPSDLGALAGLAVLVPLPKWGLAWPVGISQTLRALRAKKSTAAACTRTASVPRDTTGTVESSAARAAPFACPLDGSSHLNRRRQQLAVNAYVGRGWCNRFKMKSHRASASTRGTSTSSKPHLRYHLRTAPSTRTASAKLWSRSVS